MVAIIGARQLSEEGDAIFDELQSIYGHDEGTAKKIRSSSGSKLDVKFDSSKNLFAIAERCRDSIAVLTSICATVKKKDTGKAKINESMRHIEKYVLPFLTHAADSVERAGGDLSPMASMKYVHQRKETRKRKQAAASLNMKSATVEEQRLFLHNMEVAERKEMDGVAKETAPAPKRSRRSKGKKKPAEVTPTKGSCNDDHLVYVVSFPGNEELLEVVVFHNKKEATVRLPAPNSGKEFSKDEIIAIVGSVESGSHKRGFVTAAIAQHQKSFGVPCSAVTIRRFMNDNKEGKAIIHKEWALGAGRPTKASDDELAKLKAHIVEFRGSTVDNVDIEEMLNQLDADRLETAGLVQIQKSSVSKSTVRNITAMLADDPDITIVGSTTRKTRTREASGNSLRGSVVNNAIIGGYMFAPTAKEDPEERRMLNLVPQKNRAEVGRLWNAVSNAAGCATSLVPPALRTSTDQSTQYIFEGARNEPAKFVLTSKASATKRAVNSSYTAKSDNTYRGMRVKPTLTATAAGTMFRMVIVVNIKQHHMPPGKNFIVVKVPKLCIGGGVSISKENQDFGWVVFKSNSEGSEKEFFQWYQDKVYIPGIDEHFSVML